MTSIIVPIKNLDEAKSRLFTLLPPSARQNLVLAMLKDLMVQLKHLNDLSIYVVGRNDRVRDVANMFDARFVQENGSGGYNAAIRQCMALLSAGPVCVLPADIPLAKHHEIKTLINPIEDMQAAVRLASDHLRAGTNGLYMSSPGLLEPSFGLNSFHRHKQRALQTGLYCETPILPGLGRDIDTPADLLDLRSLTQTGHTHQLLHTVGFSNCLTNLEKGAA